MFNFNEKRIYVMKLSKIIQAIEENVPVQLQESYDNNGLQVGDVKAEIFKALISLDLTMDVLLEAKSENCNLLITHHPPIFTGIKTIESNDVLGAMIFFAIKNDIAIYSMHTSFDKYKFGVSYVLAEELLIKDLKVLSPEKNVLRKLITFCPKIQSEALRNALFSAGAGHIGEYDSCSFNTIGEGTFRALEKANPFVGVKGNLHSEQEVKIETIFPFWKQNAVIKALLAHHPYEEVAYDIYLLENRLENSGLGMIGNLEKELNKDQFLSFVKNKLKTESLRCNNSFQGNIKKVALCGGAGGSLIKEAISSGADAYITADLKYHDFQAASSDILLIDAGHYETEIFALNAIKSLLSEKLPKFATRISEIKTNFVSYFK